MDELLSQVVNLVQQAGVEIHKKSSQVLSHAYKAKGELVTESDLYVNELLKNGLAKVYPDIGWFSEESTKENNLKNEDIFWVVDPIDGTIEYASGIPEYAISIALVEKGTLQLSVVCNPAVNKLYYAVKGKGAFLNGEKIYCQNVRDDLRQPVILASRTEYAKGAWESFKAHATIKPVGSIAYKLGLIAEGIAAATFSLTPKNIWDIAGGVLLVEEAGGMVTDKLGQPLQFIAHSPKVAGMIATDRQVYEEIIFITKSEKNE